MADEKDRRIAQERRGHMKDTWLAAFQNNVHVRVSHYCRAVIHNVGYEYPQGYELGHLKVKGKVKLKFILEQATKAHRGSRGIALLFL
jgi:hypothetical protein